jgi:hypothetical protein
MWLAGWGRGGKQWLAVHCNESECRLIQEATIGVEATVMLLKCRDTVEDDVTMGVVHSHGRHVCKFQQLRQAESDVPHNQGTAEGTKPCFATQTAVMFARRTDRYRPNLGRNAVTAFFPSRKRSVHRWSTNGQCWRRFPVFKGAACEGVGGGEHGHCETWWSQQVLVGIRILARSLCNQCSELRWES